MLIGEVRETGFILLHSDEDRMGDGRTRQSDPAHWDFFPYNKEG